MLVVLSKHYSPTIISINNSKMVYHCSWLRAYDVTWDPDGEAYPLAGGH